MRLREVGVGKVLSRRGNGVNEDRPAAIMLMGATATGKSRIAEELSEHLPCEIVSVDSALVYRGMDIGTAKPSAEVRARVPHHLIDICDPSTSYSAARFRDDARAAIDAILERGRVPLLVGWFFEKISWWLNLILSLSVSLGLYAIFKIGLEVSLPQGLFWF